MESPFSHRENTGFVFHDARGKRWPRIKRVSFGVGIVLFMAAVLFIRSLLVQPELRLPYSVLKLRSQLQGMKHSRFSKEHLSQPEPGPRHTFGKERRLKQAPRAGFNPEEKIHLGFYGNKDSMALASLQRHADQLTHLSPEWIVLKDEDCNLELRNQAEVEELASSHGIRMVPLLTNFYKGWRGDLIEALVTGPKEAQDRFIHSAVALTAKQNYTGITVDFEEVAPEYSVAFNDFLVRFAEQCHDRKLQFLLCVPVGFDSEVFDLDLLAEHVDFFIGMLYHENSPHDPPGPIASQPWFDRWLKRLLEFGQPSQWIIGMGAFGCDWPASGPVGKTISFADAMATAGSTDLAHIESTKPELNPNFAYVEDSVQHTVWFLDAITAFNQARRALLSGTAGLAIWRIGMEDPALWKALRLAHKDNIPQEELDALETLVPQDHILQIGEGEIVHAEKDLQTGYRTIRHFKSGEYGAIYNSFPHYITLEHYGQVHRDWVALTFDDGPSEKWTPRILDILRDEGVPATFFVVGRHVEKYPELVQRILHEGHEIGNHSYTHANLASISEVQLDLELNATQRLLESVIGRSTVLFRPPFLADSRPQTRTEVLPILRAQKLGYVTICENIDPEDWSRPGADVVLKRIQQQREEGSVILLHDGGGDRSQTVEALPKIIHWLRNESHHQVRFVKASELIGLSREDVMPLALPQERGVIRTSSLGLGILHFFEETLWASMIMASVLVIARTLFIGTVAVLQKHTRKKEFAAKGSAPLFTPPPASVLIAAYNEEKVIVQTIRSVLENGYPGEFEIVVVDDGSRDRTREMVESAFASEKRVVLRSQANSGKSTALSRAFELAKHHILISLDADTQLAPGALQELVRTLISAENIGAVSGNTRVGNRGKWLTEFQSLEYICGFNLDRRAYDRLNCITVVPGAIGAYRRNAIEQAGGFTAETLAEDTDLTLHIRKDGWRIAYAERAVGWTESPETFRALARQRFRWAFGTLQCLWKHRDALFNFRYGTLGWAALPSMWIFQIGLVAAAPLVDSLMILSLLAGNGAEVALYFSAFVLSEILLAALALRLEGEHLWHAFWVIPQRFVYRPMLSVVVWQAIRRALRGAWVGWGKLDRTASVDLKQLS